MDFRDLLWLLRDSPLRPTPRVVHEFTCSSGVRLLLLLVGCIILLSRSDVSVDSMHFSSAPSFRDELHLQEWCLSGPNTFSELVTRCCSHARVVCSDHGALLSFTCKGGVVSLEGKPRWYSVLLRQGKEGERTACSFNIECDINFVVKIVFGL